MSIGGSDALRSLRNPGFRRYFGGQMASMCGSWAQTMAIAWLVLELTGSKTAVGTVTAVQFVPVVVLSAWAGAMADRVEEQRAVLIVQALLGIQAVVLATVVLTDVVEMWMLYGLAFVQGLGLAYDTPTRQALVGRVVGDHDLRNALSLNATLVTLARVIGPAVAGILIDTAGIGVCFVVNAASYAVVFVAVASIDVGDPRADRPVGRPRGAVAEGVRAVWARPELRDLLLLALVVGLVAVNFIVALPALVQQHFDESARLFGFLGAVYGVGSMIGAVATAARAAPTKRLILTSLAVLGAGLMACAAGTASIAVVVVGTAMAGFAGLTLGVTFNASLQLGAPPEFRGRVIGLYFLVTFGSNVLAGPVLGWIGERWDSTAAFGSSAVMVAAVTVALLVRWWSRFDEPLVRAAPG